MTLAIAAEAAHDEALGFLIRLGALFPLALALCWRVVGFGGRAERERSLAAAAAVALGTAGAIHLGLVPEHAQEGLAPGAFFVASGVAELVLAALVVSRRGGRVTLAALFGLTATLLALYGASRTWGLPSLGSEPVDSLGLLTKALEVAATALAASALTGWPRRVPLGRATGLAVVTVAAAFASRPAFGLGPRLPQALAALLAALGTTALLGQRARQGALRALTDGAVVSLLIRADGLTPFVVGGIGVAFLRHLGGRLRWPVLAPLALALLLALAFPWGDARLEILHVAHPSEPWAVLIAFALATGLVVVSAAWGGFGAAAAFLVAHLAGQALRMLAGRTSLEAVEVPAASLGLLLVATVVLSDPDVVGRSRYAGLVTGVLAGALDVVFRDAGFPYAALLAVTAGVAAGALWEVLATPQDTLPPAEPPLQPARTDRHLE